MDLVDEHNLDDIEILSDEEDEVDEEDEEDEVDEVDEVGDVDVDDIDVGEDEVDEVDEDNGESVARTVKRSKTTANAFDDVLVEQDVDPRFFRGSNDQQPPRQ